MFLRRWVRRPRTRAWKTAGSETGGSFSPRGLHPDDAGVHSWAGFEGRGRDREEHSHACGLLRYDRQEAIGLGGGPSNEPRGNFQLEHEGQIDQRLPIREKLEKHG